MPSVHSRGFVENPAPGGGGPVFDRWTVEPDAPDGLVWGDHSPELRDTPFVAPIAVSLRDQPDIFAAIRERDILVHHPYENFSSVVEFLEQAPF